MDKNARKITPKNLKKFQSINNYKMQHFFLTFFLVSRKFSR